MPFTIYYKYEDTLRDKYYKHLIKDEKKYRNKVFKEILNYITKVNMPITVSRHKTTEYIIYKEWRDDNICGDFHLKDFISYHSVGNRKTYNKKAMRYYNACTSNHIPIDYDWFMNEIEKYFKQFEDIEVERDTFDCLWGGKSEYILLNIKFIK